MFKIMVFPYLHYPSCHCFQVFVLMFFFSMNVLFTPLRYKNITIVTGLYIISTFLCYRRRNVHPLNGCGMPFPSVRHFPSSLMSPEPDCHLSVFAACEIFLCCLVLGHTPKSPVTESRAVTASVWHPVALGQRVLVRDALRSVSDNRLLLLLLHSSFSESVF